MADSQHRILLIDGAHYDRIRNVLDTNLDFERLLSELSSNGPLSRTIFYRDLRNADEVKRRGRFLDWLREVGVTVKGTVSDGEPSRERYGTNLIALAVDAMAICGPGDQLYLIAADAKLVPLVMELRTRGVLVVLISTLTGPDAVIPPPELVSACHLFVDLADRLDVLARS